jgi:hypothetical protein
MRGVPRLEEKIELHADVRVPNRREARDLDRVRADLFRDIVALREECDETVEVGCVVDSYSHAAALGFDVGRATCRPQPACEGFPEVDGGSGALESTNRGSGVSDPKGQGLNNYEQADELPVDRTVDAASADVQKPLRAGYLA